MNNILGDRLRKLRERKNLTQKRAASIFGITNFQMSRYENGQSNPDPDLISKFADQFEVTTDYLLGRTDDPGLSLDTETKGYDATNDLLKLFDEVGIEEFHAYNIEDWKSMSPEEVEEFKNYLKYLAHKIKVRKENKDT